MTVNDPSHRFDNHYWRLVFALLILPRRAPPFIEPDTDVALKVAHDEIFPINLPEPLVCFSTGGRGRGLDYNEDLMYRFFNVVCRVRHRPVEGHVVPCFGTRCHEGPLLVA